MVELAAWIWDLSIESTINKLIYCGVNTDADPWIVRSYTDSRLVARNRVNDLWEKARQPAQLHDSKVGQELVNTLNLSGDVGADRWAAGPGQLFGVCRKRDVDACFMDEFSIENYEKSSHEPRLCGGHPASWGDVLLFPLYDLPQRICAVLCVGRSGRESSRFLRDTLDGHRKWLDGYTQIFEAGLAYHPNLLEAASRRDNTIVAVNSPVLAAQLQIRHLGSSLSPLPFVAWQERSQSSNCVGRTVKAWRQFPNYKKVIWMPRLSAEEFRQAMHANSDVSLWRPGDELDKYCAKASPDELFRQVARTAIPWQEGLSQAIEKMSPRDCQDLMFRLELEATVMPLREVCSKAARARIDAALELEKRPKTVAMSDYVIDTTNDLTRIIASRKNSVRDRLVCDAVLIVDNVLHEERGETFYEGTIHYKGKSIHFCEPRDDIEGQPIRWLANYLLKNGHGLLKHRKVPLIDIVQLSFRLREPEFKVYSGLVGWDEKENVFRFPKFCIGANGTVMTSESPVLERHPTVSLPAPGRIGFDDVASPEDAIASETYWAILAALLCEILAPVYGRRAPGLGLAGLGAITTGRTVASALCCDNVLKTLKNNNFMEYGNDWLTRGHKWPISVFSSSPEAFINDTVLSSDAASGKWLVLPVSNAGSIAMRLTGGWNIVTCERSVLLPTQYNLMPARLTMAYLQDLCQRGLMLDENTLDKLWFTDVLVDLANFVGKHDGDAESVLRARNRIFVAGTTGQAAALVSVFLEFARRKRLRIGQKRNYSAGYANLVSVGKNEILIPFKSATVANERRQTPGVAADYVTAALASEGVLVRVAADGWVVPESWFTAELEKQLAQ